MWLSFVALLVAFVASIRLISRLRHAAARRNVAGRTKVEDLKAIGATNGKQRTCVVTGASGFVGSHLVDLLLGEGSYGRVIAFDVRKGGRKRAKEAKNEVVEVVGDICDKKGLKELLRDVEAVFHVASVIDTRNGEVQRELLTRVNVLGAVSVLEACQECDVSRLVYTSSVASFLDGQCIREAEELAVRRREGGQEVEWDGETFAGRLDDLVPSSVYGWTKRQAERILLEAGRTNAAKGAMARAANVATLVSENNDGDSDLSEKAERNMKEETGGEQARTRQGKEKPSLRSNPKAKEVDDNGKERDDRGLRVIALRPHLLYGEKDSYFTEQVVLANPPAPCANGGDNRMLCCYGPNLAAYHMQADEALAAKRELSGTAHFVGDELVPVRVIYQRLLNCRPDSKQPREPTAVSAALLYPLAVFSEAVDWVTGGTKNWALLQLNRKCLAYATGEYPFVPLPAIEALGLRQMYTAEEIEKRIQAHYKVTAK